MTFDTGEATHSFPQREHQPISFCTNDIWKNTFRGFKVALSQNAFTQAALADSFRFFCAPVIFQYIFNQRMARMAAAARVANARDLLDGA